MTLSATPSFNGWFLTRILFLYVFMLLDEKKNFIKITYLKEDFFQLYFNPEFSSENERIYCLPLFQNPKGVA